MRAISELLPPSALARISNLNLVARWIVEGFIAGLHKSPYHGFSVEFAEFRQYTAGDDLRHFDWKALAKSDRKYIRKYHCETNMVAHLVLDCSASMNFGAPITKLQYGKAVAAALAYLLILQHDATGVALFSNDVVKYLPPKSTMRHFREIVTTLEQAQPATTTNITTTLHYLAETVKRRGLFVIVSDLYDDPQKIVQGLRHIRFRRHEVVLFHVLDQSELKFPYVMLTEFKDLETGERVQVAPTAYREGYLKAVDEFTAGLRKQCANMLVDYQLIDTSEPFDKVLARYLYKRQQLG